MRGIGRIEVGVVSTEAEVQRLLPLMRGYCDFYRVRPSDTALLSMARALVADPTREGVQLIATDGDHDVGFATLFWSWETTTAGRVGVMNDLYVVTASRGRGRLRADRGMPRALPGAWSGSNDLADRGRQSGRPGRLRPRWRHSGNLGRLLARHRRVPGRGHGAGAVAPGANRIGAARGRR